MSTIVKLCGALLIGAVVLAMPAARTAAAPAHGAEQATTEPARPQAMALSEPVLLVALGGAMIGAGLVLRHLGERSRG